MTTANVQHDANSAAEVEDVADIDTNVPAPADEAKEVLAKARYEAFRLMTDARQEAEEILDQARTEGDAIRKEAELQAESIVDAAHTRAEEIRDELEHQAPDETSDARNQLEQEHDELTERVSGLRSLADQLEERFAALAQTAARRPSIEEPPRPILDYSPSVPHHEPEAQPEPSPEPAPEAPWSAAEADASTAPVLDYSPSVPHPSPAPTDESEPDSEPEREERGSFYSRRSAKLPRIGESAGQSALDMMRSIRENFDGD